MANNLLVFEPRKPTFVNSIATLFQHVLNIEFYLFFIYNGFIFLRTWDLNGDVSAVDARGRCWAVSGISFNAIDSDYIFM